MQTLPFYHVFIIAHCNISGNMMKSVRNLLRNRDLMLFTYLVMYLHRALFCNFYQDVIAINSTVMVVAPSETGNM